MCLVLIEECIVLLLEPTAPEIILRTCHGLVQPDQLGRASQGSGAGMQSRTTNQTEVKLERYWRVIPLLQHFCCTANQCNVAGSLYCNNRYWHVLLFLLKITWGISGESFGYLFMMNTSRHIIQARQVLHAKVAVRNSQLSSTHIELEKRRLCLRTNEEGDVLAHHRDGEYRSVPAMARGRTHISSQQQESFTWCTGMHASCDSTMPE